MVFAAFGLPFLIAGMVPLGLGAFVLYGRSEVRVAHGKLVNIERAFPFRWSWSRNISEITRLSVSQDAVKVNDKPITEGPLAKLATIAARTKAHRPMLVAPGYPREWLRTMADELAYRCQTESDSLFVETDQPIEVVEENLGKSEDEDPFREARLGQPPESLVEIDRLPTGITLKVPPPGIRKGSRGLFGFSLVWNGFIAVFTVVLIAVAFEDQEALYGLLFMIPFWAVGIGTLLSSINMGRRNAVLAVVADRLMIMQTGIFGTKRREWNRNEVKTIRSGPTGSSVNDVPIMELQVTDQQDKVFGALSGREPNELSWLAFELTESLGGTSKS